MDAKHVLQEHRAENAVAYAMTVPEQAPYRSERAQSKEDLIRSPTAVPRPYALVQWTDHLMGEILEGGSAAGCFSTLHLGLQWWHTVLFQSLRNLTFLVQMGATLQLMSDGRFVIGLGAEDVSDD